MAHTAGSRSGAGGIGLALAAGAMWGSLGLITHELLRYGLSAAQLAMLRLGGAFVITMLIALVLGRLRRLSWRQWGLLALIGLFCQALSSVSFSNAVAGAGSSLAIVLLCMGPLFTAAINRLAFGERLSAKAWCGIALALIGIALAVLCGRGETSAAQVLSAAWLIGIAWGLVSGLCYGVFPIFARFLGPIDSWVLVSFSLGLGAVFLAPMQGGAHAGAAWWSAGGMLWLWIALLIVVPTVLADVLYVQAIARGGPMLATVFALVEVPASAVYAWWLLDAPIAATQWIGIGLFCAGLAGLAMQRSAVAADSDGGGAPLEESSHPPSRSASAIASSSHPQEIAP